jgi:hypothetical protein
VAAGWAIDLFIGHESRTHDDLEIVVARASFAAARAALPELRGPRCASWPPRGPQEVPLCREKIRGRDSRPLGAAMDSAASASSPAEPGCVGR